MLQEEQQLYNNHIMHRANDDTLDIKDYLS
jgi:hypothetical protein